MKLGSFVLTSILAVAITTQANAETKKYSAELSPDNEVPVVAGGPGPALGDSNPSGELEVIYDDKTKRLCGVFKYRDLTGPPTQFHLHLGAEGVNSPEKIILPVPAGLTKDDETGYKFNVALNTQYETGLASAGIYGNIHTAANKDGELRATLFAFDGFADPECPPPTVLTGGGTDGGAATDGGGSTSGESSTSSSSSTSGAPAQTPSDTPSGTTTKKDAGAAAPAEEGGCSTAAGAANVTWLIAFGAVGLIAMRSRRRRTKR